MSVLSDSLPWRWAPGQSIAYTTNVDHDELANLGFDGTTTIADAGMLGRLDGLLARWTAVADIHFQPVADWSAADLGIYLDPVDGYRGTLGYTYVDDADGDGLLSGAAGERALIGLDPADSNAWVQTLVHEVGHVIGIGHIDHEYSVMASSTTGAAGYVTGYDAEVARAIYGDPTGIPATNGGGGDDFLIGHPNADALMGGSGADTLMGFGGNDVLYGNTDSDVLYGGYGSDILYGGQGGDILSGGAGDDIIYGNRDNDVLLGGADDDTLYGGQGADVLYGGDGLNVLIGGRGADVFHADHDDTIIGFEDGVDAVVLIGVAPPTFSDFFV